MEKILPLRPFSLFPQIGALALAAFLAAFAWPLETLEISVVSSGNTEEGEFFSRSSTLLGQDLTASIVHSVELTPVVDVYRVQEGRIWGWQEKTRSHNAGLPYSAPERGRFRFESPWLITEGGGLSWERVYYRVGTEELGRNVLCVFAKPCRKLWQEAPGKKLCLRVGSENFSEKTRQASRL